jgi:hypothetical protein
MKYVAKHVGTYAHTYHHTYFNAHMVKDVEKRKSNHKTGSNFH